MVEKLSVSPKRGNFQAIAITIYRVRHEYSKVLCTYTYIRIKIKVSTSAIVYQLNIIKSFYSKHKTIKNSLFKERIISL